MKLLTKLTLTLTLLFFAAGLNAQLMLSSWLRNTTGKKASYWASSGGMNPTFTFTNTNDSADVLTVAYNNNYVYIRSNGMTDSMGKYLNPGTCVSQAYTHKFPRTQTVPTTKTISPKVGQIGLLLNGIPIYGLSNANSWNGSTNSNNGSGVWNVEVGKSEGFVLDTTLGAHPQQQGAYHSHTRPNRLYTKTPSSQHSPIVGFAFDGYPVYGPYAYSNPLDATSSVTRMKSGYSLRNITTRTTLPYGVAASQTGPAVSTTYPLGTYCEDYEWSAANGGDLDKYNGRFCVTPDFPSGTYAYFITLDAAGNAAFPYYVGIEYYGAPETGNFPHGPSGNGLSVPTGVLIYNGSTLPLSLTRFDGKQSGNVNKLYWTIANTSGNNRIVLQRSIDQVTFKDIAAFQASTAEDYEYTDEQPSRKNYYRLKVMDATGGITYSAIININNSIRSTVHIYPTITTGSITIAGMNPSEATTVVFTDTQGKKAGAYNLSTGEQASLNVSVLSPGLYFVTIVNGSYNETFKILKQ